METAIIERMQKRLDIIKNVLDLKNVSIKDSFITQQINEIEEKINQFVLQIRQSANQKQQKTSSIVELINNQAQLKEIGEIAIENKIGSTLPNYKKQLLLIQAQKSKFIECCEYLKKIQNLKSSLTQDEKQQQKFSEDLDQFSSKFHKQIQEFELQSKRVDNLLVSYNELMTQVNKKLVYFDHVINQKQDH